MHVRRRRPSERLRRRARPCPRAACPRRRTGAAAARCAPRPSDRRCRAPRPRAPRSSTPCRRDGTLAARRATVRAPTAAAARARPLHAPVRSRRAAGTRSSIARPTMCRTTSPSLVSARAQAGHALAVAQHRDAVGQREHLAQAVRDVDQRHAALPQLAQDSEQAVASRSLSAAVGSSRISTRARLCSARAISTSCACPTPSSPTGRSGIDAGARSVSSSARALAQHACAVDQKPSRVGSCAEEDVLGRRQLGHQRELLVDHRDAGALGVAHAAKALRRCRRPAPRPRSCRADRCRRAP